MGLSRRWTSWAVGRAHALVVEVPGWWATRIEVERALAGRGWPLALSPADADVLIVCGDPGERLASAVQRVWEQLPGPRARTSVTGTGVVLDELAARLADDALQRADARCRTEQTGGAGEDSEMAPAGIPLAGGAGDRDGLEMDELHVPLGPVLPHWPAGLVLRCTLHGDVVAAAEVEVLGAGSDPPDPSPAPAALACDGAARLLAVAGWDDAAAAARRVRDLVLDGTTDPDEVLPPLDRLRSRVARSWSLRWMLRGIGVLDQEALHRHGLPDRARGDVHDRLVGMLASAGAELRGEHSGEPAAISTAALPPLVTGLELAAVRLVVASLDPDTTTVPARGRADV